MNMVFKFFLILILGSLAGFFATKIIMSYSSGATIINKTERVIIQEDNALEEAIQKVKSSVVLINNIQTGFIVSSDGLIVTAINSDLVKKKSIIISWRDKNFPAKLFKLDSNFIFLKVEPSMAVENLPMVSFSDAEPSLGEKVFLITSNFVNSGIIKTFDKITISTNIKESNSLALGSPLVNLKGEVIAINYKFKVDELQSFIIKDLTNLF